MRATSKAALVLVSVAVLLAGGAAAVRAQSALDGFDPNANGTIRAVVMQPDGKILIGGDFTALSPNGGTTVTCGHLARLNPDGTLDTLFNPNANGEVDAIAVQADGKILVGGVFFSSGGGNSIGGKPLNFLARLDPTTGAADTSFNPNPNSDVQSIAVQPDGKILVGGDFNQSNGTPTIGGATRNNIARLSATGVADSFDPNADSAVDVITVQTDGKILAGGTFNSIGGQTRHHVARLDAITGLPDSFAPDPNGTVHAIALHADGKILIGGSFGGTVGGQPRSNIAQLDATGAADTFNPSASGEVDAIAVQTDGKVLAGGLFTTIGGQARNKIARLDATNGAADTAVFNPNANAPVLVIAVQSDGKILAGGQFTTMAPNGGATVTRNRIARLETDGRLDRTLSDLGISGGGKDVIATTVQADGKILIGGIFTSVLGVPRNNIARLNTDGTLDLNFDPNANSDVRAIAVQADGKILIGGYFTTLQPDGATSATMRNRIARLFPDGTLDESFNQDANDEVDAIALQADGKIVVAGLFSTLTPNGGAAVPRNYLARLNPDGTVDPNFNPNVNSLVYSIGVQADGKVLLAGDFTSLSPDGDGGGAFPRNHFARLNPVGTLDKGFDPNANKVAYSIWVQADGRILAAGDFTTFTTAQPNGATITTARNHIARLNATTGAPDSFDPNADSTVLATAVQADGKILVAGNFTSIGGQPRSRFARLSNDTAALQNLAVTQSTITWTRTGSGPQFTRVTCESSTDNVTYTPLGNGTASGSNWTLTGLNLPTGQNIYIRARGYYRSSYESGWESITESVRNAFFVATGISGTASSATTVGGTISDAATLSGGVSPTGSITFNVYGPNDSTCGGAVVFTSTATVNGDGTYSSAAFTPTAAGTYRFVVSYSGDTHSASFATACGDASETVVVSPAPTPTPTPTPTPAPGLVGNVSTRLPVGAGDNVLIEGFTVQGPAGSAKKIIVRAIGPSLIPFGIADALANPTLEIHDAGNGNAIVAANDDWRVTQAGGIITADQSAEIAASGFAPGNDHESAIIANLVPGSYTAVVRGLGNSVGTGVVDAYDLSATSPATLVNIATRGLIQPGDKLMVAGFIIQNGPVRAVVSALGPSLAAFGITNALPDTTLQLRDVNGNLVVENDNWKVRSSDGSSQQAELEATHLQPSNDLEAAFVTTLQPGQYTAQVRGKPESTGIGVVQVYFLQ